MAEPPGAARRDGDGSVTPERWQRISDIVADALAIDDLRARAEFVRDAVADDTAMLKEIDALLVYAETPAPTLTPEALAQGIRATLGEAELATAVAGRESVAVQRRWIGRRVGAWRITEAIASGGMGSVWKAVRADDAYQQTVAIKVVRTALADEGLLRRFLAERQLLATLEHPNIARLLDGGQLDDGTPYLVLEYVEGQPIDAWCNAHELGIDRRLDLFVAVCGAVHYAHQRLIVHRDLKPGNILVDGEERVKLLDFGIARLLDPDVLDPSGRVPAAAPTEANAMTPAYASPEQIKGQPITTASDVYALGVLLYRLLTGHSPYRSQPGEPLALAREIAETEPTRPSTALARSATHTAQRSRARALRGDLDNIVLKAMQKAPERRYASAEQLADDVRRYRDNLPVRARPDSWRYRSWKFVMRNR
ncbi:MAG: protein kinase, partial [Burkholderiales bacterium]|nr:protein kinase [Burkholderiales bacterium]